MLHDAHATIGEDLVDVECRAILGVVDEDIRVGRDGILNACERLAGVCQHLAVVAPCDLCYVEVGRQRCIPCCICAEDILVVLNAIGSKVGHEDVAVLALIPVVQWRAIRSS